MVRLTTDINVDLPTHLQPFQIGSEMKTKSENFDFDVNFTTEQSITSHFEMHPYILYALMYPLQIINGHFIH